MLHNTDSTEKKPGRETAIMSKKCQRNLTKRKEDNADTYMETQTAVSKANNRNKERRLDDT